MLSQKQIDDIRQFFEGDRAVVAGYLFGSFAKGKISDSSDIDVALLIKKDVAPDLYTDLAIRYSVSLSKALGREADVVILNEAPPFLRYQVFRYGQPIFERDRKESRAFIARTIQEYFDFEPLKRIMEQKAIKRLKEQPL